MKKGEIWRVLIPAAPGHAQSGERPAIILQELAFNNSLPTTLIVPLTSKLAASRFDGTLVVQPDQQNGLTAPSAALVFQMRTLDQRYFEREAVRGRMKKPRPTVQESARLI